MRGTMRAMAVAACLALAGCTGGTATPSAEPSPSGSPDASASASAPASSSPDAAATCGWNAGKGDLAVVPDRAAGLPGAVEMADWVWDCVDSTWSVEAVTVRGDDGIGEITAQELDLVAPDGVRVLLYPLRVDVAVDVVDSDMGARVAWTSRYGLGDSFQVVELDLVTGESTEDWGGDAIPSTAVVDGRVYDVAPLRPLPDGTDLWAAHHHMGGITGLFVHEGASTFSAVPGASRIEDMVDEGADLYWGDPGVAIWVAPDEPLAVVLGQRQVGSNPYGSSELARWLVIDLDTGETRETTGALPSGLCYPDPDGVLSGTYDDPGEIPAMCWVGEDGAEPYALSLTAAPVAR